MEVSNIAESLQTRVSFVVPGGIQRVVELPLVQLIGERLTSEPLTSDRVHTEIN